MQTSTTNYKPRTSLHIPTVVTRKGQITIPAPIREALGIKEGDTISVALEGLEVKIEPVSRSLAESYQSVPVLSSSHSWKDILDIAHEDQAERVSKKS